MDIGMNPQRNVWPVVQSGSFQMTVRDVEPQRLDQVKGGTGRGARAGNVPGILWNFRLDQNHLYHDLSRGRPEKPAPQAMEYTLQSLDKG